MYSFVDSYPLIMHAGSFHIVFCSRFVDLPIKNAGCPWFSIGFLLTLTRPGHPRCHKKPSHGEMTHSPVKGRRSSTGCMRSPCQANKPGAVFFKTYSGLALRTGGSQGSPGSRDGGNYDGRVNTMGKIDQEIMKACDSHNI